MELDTQGPAGRARYKRLVEFKREVQALGYQIQIDGSFYRFLPSNPWG
jgi:hypothetical protein